MGVSTSTDRAVGTHTCSNCGGENTGFMRALNGQIICPDCGEVF